MSGTSWYPGATGISPATWSVVGVSVPRGQRWTGTSALAAALFSPFACGCALIASGRSPIPLTAFGDAARQGAFGLGAFLPGLFLVHQHHFYGGHLVLRTVGRPVGVLGGDDVGVGLREMERG